MLSAETSAGKHPIEAVCVMARIATETEIAVRDKGFPEFWINEEMTIAEIIADAAYHSARSAKVVALAVGTSTGASARLLARYKPPVPIYAFTSDEIVARQLSVIAGVEAIKSPSFESTDHMLQEMEVMLVSSGRAQPGDNIVFVAGQPVNLRGSTNMLKLHRIADIRV
jgi:pyruvate kinase